MNRSDYSLQIEYNKKISTGQDVKDLNRSMKETVFNMNLLEKLKLDTWYGIVLYLGAILIAAALFVPSVVFVDVRHLFGLGLGMAMIGIAYYIAETNLSRIKPPNAYTGPAALISWIEFKHNPFSVSLLLIGLGCVGYFGFHLVKSLI